MTIKLRNWQQQAIDKAINWLVVDNQDRHFLTNAAPGAGKTLFACVLSQKLISLDEIDRVIVIAPRKEVVNQWADDFRMVTDRHMMKVTASVTDVSSMQIDVCATWSAVQGLLPEFQAMCRSSRTLVICDEHHHAAVAAAWGKDANSAFADAKHVLVLTGTPIRSDGEESIWLAYDDKGAIDHPEAGTYTLSYGEAVDLGYCRPVTFHRHDGKFSVDLEDGQSVEVSGHKTTILPGSLKRVPGLQSALDFYRLAKKPQYENDQYTPLMTGYQASMLEWGIDKLNELRNRMPDAGGLVIAPNIEMAEYLVDLIELMEGEKPMLVHSQMADPTSKISAFRNTDKRWLVSVAMVSEGVDIKRLRVLVYLPNALTELSFRQAIGRVVRTRAYDDDTRAYVIMPSFETFDVYARRVEEEMPVSMRKESANHHKKCAICHTENSLNAKQCKECGHEFPQQQARNKTCDACDTINPASASSCINCGESFEHNFDVSLKDALRDGVIARGMDFNEQETQESEAMASSFRRKVINTGDERLIKIIKTLPDESWSRLKHIMAN